MPMGRRGSSPRWAKKNCSLERLLSVLHPPSVEPGKMIDRWGEEVFRLLAGCQLAAALHPPTLSGGPQYLS